MIKSVNVAISENDSKEHYTEVYKLEIILDRKALEYVQEMLQQVESRFSEKEDRNSKITGRIISHKLEESLKELHELLLEISSKQL